MEIILFPELRHPGNRTVYSKACLSIPECRYEHLLYLFYKVRAHANIKWAEPPRGDQDHLSKSACNDEEMSGITHTKWIIQHLDN